MIRSTRNASFCFLCLLTGNVAASSFSIGPDGINAAVLQSDLNLRGMDIAIGQVEPGRPGMEPTDDPANRHNDVDPVAVFRFNQGPNTADVRPHAQRVAGVMISKDTGSLAGVAPEAQLYASAAPSTLEEDHVRALNHIASRNGRDVRAMNLSYGLPLGGLGSTDGNSYFTRGLDWLATAYGNTLFVVAGNEGTSAPLPTDNYNGIVVGASALEDNVYRRVSDVNTYDENPTQDRTAIGLIAPGEDIPLTMPGSTSTTAPHPAGSSYAAPHVTGTVALLQQLGEKNTVDIGGDRWATGNFREHEVSKAVLLNSADKISNVHGSSRTVESTDGTGNYTWEQSFAFTNDAQPLDIQFGAGHLNALRAATQLAPGEWDNGSDIPLIGWDFGETGGVGTTLRYTFDAELAAGAWIAITLTWDRDVFKTGDEDNFSPGDMFTVGVDNGLSNLDLFLVPEGSNDFGAATALRSIATEQNVEHIFAKVPGTGSYDLV